MDRTVITFSAENTFTIGAMVIIMFTVFGMVGKIVRNARGASAGNA